MSTTSVVARPGRVGRRSAYVLIVVSLVGLVGMIWPLLAAPGSALLGHSQDAPWLFIVLLPLLIALVLAELSDGGMDSRGIAMLGVLSAIAAALRPFGAGAVGFEPMWVIIILGGRALGPGFGFLLGNVSLFASALLTGGIGPWLPFQMIVAGWIGLGAGLLPSVRARWEPVVLAAYGAVVSLLYGSLLNLWFWPWALTADNQLAFVPGDPLLENLHRWILFDLATSLGFDIPRAIVVAVLLLFLARPLLFVIRRATHKAAFGAPITFDDAPTDKVQT